MNEPQKTNPYAAAVLGPCGAFWTAVMIGLDAYDVRHGYAGLAVLHSLASCLFLAAAIYHIRIVWLELRKSDPHYQKP